jgi:hypothetical protein
VEAHRACEERPAPQQLRLLALEQMLRSMKLAYELSQWWAREQVRKPRLPVPPKLRRVLKVQRRKPRQEPVPV